MTQQRSAPSGGSEVRAATAADTRKYLIERSGRSFAPIPKVFIQNPDPKATPDRGAPLADFVRRGDKRALLALMMLYTIISSGDHDDGWSSTLPLQVWARALDTVATATGSSATSAATKIFTRLVQRDLIERRRTGRERKITITLLSADGSGTPYTRPTGKTKDDRFIRLNHQFWTQDWAHTLSLPAIAMLLVALHEKPGFFLPTEHMPKWYGWSADTAERGLRELDERGLIHIDKQVYTDPISPSGLSSKNRYTVLAPFDVASVNTDAAAQAKARQ